MAGRRNRPKISAFPDIGPHRQRHRGAYQKRVACPGYILWRRVERGELIRRQPYTRKSLYHVYLTQLGETSLEILLYFFMECPNWAVELRERQSLLLDIMRLAEELDVKFAFPTQTLHLNEFEPPQPHIELGDDPVRSGRERAARLSGPVLSAEERPGKVQYPEPLDLNELNEKPQDASGEPPEPPVVT